MFSFHLMLNSRGLSSLVRMTINGRSARSQRGEGQSVWRITAYRLWQMWQQIIVSRLLLWRLLCWYIPWQSSGARKKPLFNWAQEKHFARTSLQFLKWSDSQNWWNRQTLWNQMRSYIPIEFALVAVKGSSVVLEGIVISTAKDNSQRTWTIICFWSLRSIWDVQKFCCACKCHPILHRGFE